MPSLTDLRAVGLGQKLLWSVRRGSSFLGVHDLFAESAVLSADDSAEYDGIAGARFFTFDALRNTRDDYDRDLGPILDQVWNAAEASLKGRGWRALVSLRGPVIEQWAARTGSTLHRLDADLFAHLNDKRTLFDILQRLQLPPVPGEWTTVDTHGFGHWHQLYAVPFVVQAPAGGGGLGTAFVGSDPEWRLAAERFAGQPVHIAPYLGPLSLNVNALAAPGRSVAGYPNVQLTGLDFLNYPAGAYCGNDFSAVAGMPHALLDEVREQTERVGNEIAAMGFRGLFGLDFLIGKDDGVPRIVDLNPRWQGSTPLFAQAERRAGRVPLTAAAMLCEADVISAADAADFCANAFEPVVGAQVRVRTAAPGIHRADDPPRPGIHSAAGAYLRPGPLLEQLQDDEILVTGGPPRPGLNVAQYAQLFRVAALESMLRPGSADVAEWLPPLVQWLMRGC